jgi:hypothetical protein
MGLLIQYQATNKLSKKNQGEFCYEKQAFSYRFAHPDAFEHDLRAGAIASQIEPGSAHLRG